MILHSTICILCNITEDVQSTRENSDTISEGIKDVSTTKQTIAILGSGDFGRALAKRLVQSGFNVIIGSRDPQLNL